MRPGAGRQRPLLKTVFDAIVFLSLLAMIVLGLRETGWLKPESGVFIAIDGDSLRKGEEEFRLHGIDAPELHQTCRDLSGIEYDCGREALALLRQLVAERELDCSIIEIDRYHRNVAICRAGSLDINAEMVRRGFAVAYRQHSHSYVDEEMAARREKRGIWRGTFEEPEAWRAWHRLSLD